MSSGAQRKLFLVPLLVGVTTWASAQSFRVQCPTSTITHPDTTTTQLVNSSEPAYTVPTTYGPSQSGAYLVPTGNVNGAIKCQQISGGDGYSTMGDGTQTYMFSFGPLSGITDISNGLPGTQFPNVFNVPSLTTLVPGDPATSGVSYNGAVGLAPDLDNGGAIDGHVDPRPLMDVGVMNGNIPAPLMAID